MLKSKVLTYFFTVILAIFGLLTLFLSGSIIFDCFGMRAKQGNYVLIVVWANFICSILYLFAVYGFIQFRKWTFKVLVASLIILMIAMLGLFVHMIFGGLYETKTIGAILFRIMVTIAFAVFSYLKINKEAK
ncbi:MAG: hypothetical protein WBN17_08705 [Aureibaculum sp.]